MSRLANSCEQLEIHDELDPASSLIRIFDCRNDGSPASVIALFRNDQKLRGACSFQKWIVENGFSHKRLLDVFSESRGDILESRFDHETPELRMRHISCQVFFPHPGEVLVKVPLCASGMRDEPEESDSSASSKQPPALLKEFLWVGKVMQGIDAEDQIYGVRRKGEGLSRGTHKRGSVPACSGFVEHARRRIDPHQFDGQI